MRFFYVLRYFFFEAASNLWSNRLNNLISIAIISFSLFTLGLFLLTAENLGKLMTRWTENVQVNVFLQKDAQRQDTTNLESTIKTSPCVARFRYITQQEALERFRAYYPNMRQLTEQLDTNPFPPSYEITIRREFQNKGKVQELVQQLRTQEHVEDVEYDQEWIDRIQLMIQFVQIVGIFFGGVLMSAATFSISNVIKLMVLSRRDEIEIMRLVGATNSFIKGPFLAEGILQGFLGGAAAIVCLYTVYSAVTMKVLTLNAPFFSAAQLHFLLPWMSTAIISGGMLVGFVGSHLSLGKLLRI